MLGVEGSCSSNISLSASVSDSAPVSDLEVIDAGRLSLPQLSLLVSSPSTSARSTLLGRSISLSSGLGEGQGVIRGEGKISLLAAEGISRYAPKTPVLLSRAV